MIFRDLADFLLFISLQNPDFAVQYHGMGVFTYQNGMRIEGKWTMGVLEGSSKVLTSEGETSATTWNFAKTGVTVTVGDFTLTQDPLPELPRRLALNFFNH